MKKIKDIEEFSIGYLLDEDNNNLFTFLESSISDTLTKNGIDNTTDIAQQFLGLFADSEDETVSIDNSIEYFIEHSNEKYISPLFCKLMRYYDSEELTFDELLTQVSRLISSHYAVKWYKIYTALMTDYAPLENYDMEEVRTPNLSKGHTLMVSGTQSGSNHEEVNTNLSTRQLVDEDSKDATNTDISKTTGVDTETGVYGFNSNNSNPSATGESDTTERTQGTKANNYIEKTHDADNTETVTGSKNDNYKDSTSSGTESKTESSTDTETGTETLTRHGNIGVTTSQQMLESEIKLRQYNFIEEMYKDIDSILCLKIY